VNGLAVAVACGAQFMAQRPPKFAAYANFGEADTGDDGPRSAFDCNRELNKLAP